MMLPRRCIYCDRDNPTGICFRRSWEVGKPQPHHTVLHKHGFIVVLECLAAVAIITMIVALLV